MSRGTYAHDNASFGPDSYNSYAADIWLPWNFTVGTDSRTWTLTPTAGVSRWLYDAPDPSIAPLTSRAAPNGGSDWASMSRSGDRSFWECWCNIAPINPIFRHSRCTTWPSRPGRRSNSEGVQCDLGQNSPFSSPAPSWRPFPPWRRRWAPRPPSIRCRRARRPAVGERAQRRRSHRSQGTIHTSPSGSVQLRFLDKSSLSVAPNTSIVIDDFVYDPNSNSGHLVTKLTEGALRYVGGELSHEGEATISRPPPRSASAAERRPSPTARRRNHPHQNGIVTIHEWRRRRVTHASKNF